MNDLKKLGSLMFRSDRSSEISVRLLDLFAGENVPVDQIVQYAKGDQVFGRVSWEGCAGWETQKECEAALDETLADIQSSSNWQVRLSSEPVSVGVFCSEQTHVLTDLLKRVGSGYFPAYSIPFICSDFEPAKAVADRFGIPFFNTNLTAASDGIEQLQMEVLSRYSPDVLALARYDSLLSQKVIDSTEGLILSVHNSFLPSVKSEKAYALAHDQGLKLLGATARLVEAKTQGPIVAQGVLDVKAGDDQQEFIQKGQNVERKIFVKALRKVVEHKVLVYNAKTIVFD
ncbi:MAG: hypothetical protein MK188_10735 [Gammaproteobacteria bacterium]|nr:hypothetical protein [Gammaproteobacteria bacterium]